MAIEAGATGVGTTDPASSTATGATQSTGTALTSTGSTGATGSGTPSPSPKWEDDPRAKGILADLAKERKARQEHAAKVAAFEARLAERDRQIAALTNSRVPSAEENDEAEVRARIEAMYPGLKGLTPERLAKLDEIEKRSEQIESFTEQQMTKHSRQMLADVHKGIEKEFGELTPSMKKRINAAYIAEAENPEFLTRHDAGDPTLVGEFVKSYLEDVMEPARRKVTANEVNRNRQVPFGKDRSLPLSGGKPIDVNDSKAVEDLLVAGYKNKGGEWSGRR